MHSYHYYLLVGAKNVGVDLFLLGSAPPSKITTVTPKPKEQVFANDAATVLIDRASFRINIAADSATNGVLSDAIKRFQIDVFNGAEHRDDRALSMAAGTCTSLEVCIMIYVPCGHMFYE